MRYLFLILVLFTTTVYSQVQIVDDIDLCKDMDKYISNPNSDDTLCINEIKKAKEDVSNGKVVFTQQVGFLYGFIRYEKELEQLCKEKGLVYEVELISDVIFEGQTQGCYGMYMDKIIEEKYGANFKEMMHQKADSLFLENIQKQNEAVQYWDCDERPRLPNEKERKNDYLCTIFVKDINIKKSNEQYGGWPFFDFGFTIEKDSTISRFYIGSWVPELEENDKYKDTLSIITAQYILDNYPIWIPGKIDGEIVRTENNVRIFLKKE